MNVDSSADPRIQTAGNLSTPQGGLSAYRKRVRTRIPWGTMLVLVAVAAGHGL